MTHVTIKLDVLAEVTFSYTTSPGWMKDPELLEIEVDKVEVLTSDEDLIAAAEAVIQEHAYS